MAFQLRVNKIIMSLITRFVIIITIVVSIVDAIGFYTIKKYPERLTVPFVILIIIGTVIPITINIWWWLRKM